MDISQSILELINKEDDLIALPEDIKRIKELLGDNPIEYLNSILTPSLFLNNTNKR